MTSAILLSISFQPDKSCRLKAVFKYYKPTVPLLCDNTLDLYSWGYIFESCSSQNVFLSCNRQVVISHYIKTCYTITVYFPKIYNNYFTVTAVTSGASVDATSQVCSFATLMLPIVGN
jgi:hypothetical protein